MNCFIITNNVCIRYDLTQTASTENHSPRGGTNSKELKNYARK